MRPNSSVMYGKPRLLVTLCLGAELLCFGCDAVESAAGEGVLDAGPETGDGEAEGATTDTDTDTDTDTGTDTSTDTSNGTAPSDGCDVPSPYMGGWDIGCCQDNVVSGAWSPGGVGPGTVLPDWTVTDQHGDAVRLYDFCHEVIYFDYAAMWCAACQAHAPELANLFNTYDERGLMTLTYMSESIDGSPATQADVQSWASTYAQDGMVVFSSLQEVWYPFAIDVGGGSFSISLPGTMLVGTGAKISKLGIPTIQEIELILPGG